MSAHPVKATGTAAAPALLVRDIRALIETGRSAVAATANAGLTMLYWRIGERINREMLKGKRADYGKQILATLSQELSQDYGDGFTYSALTRMIKFAECLRIQELLPRCRNN